MESVDDAAHRASTIIASSQSSQLDTLGSGVVSQKDGYQLEAASDGMMNAPWYTRMLDKAKTNFPITHRRVSRALLYTRGPKPPVPLPRKSVSWPRCDRPY